MLQVSVCFWVCLFILAVLASAMIMGLFQFNFLFDNNTEVTVLRLGYVSASSVLKERRTRKSCQVPVLGYAKVKDAEDANTVLAWIQLVLPL